MIKNIKSIFARRHLQQEESLPDYGLLYFDHLYGEYRSLPAINIDQECQSTVNEFLTKRQNNSLVWNDLYTFDLILARLQPCEKLPRKVWSLRSRYRDATSLQEYNAYMASNPPNLEGKVEESDLRTDAEYLMSELYLRYALRPIREKMLNSLSRRVATVTAVGLLIVLIYGFLANIDTSKIPVVGNLLQGTALSITLLVGAMGGLGSMLQRYQTASDQGDPIHNVSKLKYGRSMYLSMVSGSIFSGVLYLIIVAGLMEGELFPKISETTDESLEKSRLLSSFLTKGPTTITDYAKMIIWSFIAGFAERFVPSTLSQLVARKETDSVANS